MSADLPLIFRSIDQIESEKITKKQLLLCCIFIYFIMIDTYSVTVHLVNHYIYREH